MTATDIREIQRSLERMGIDDTRSVPSLDRVTRAVEFAADMADEFERFARDEHDPGKATKVSRLEGLTAEYWKMAREMVP